MGKYVEISESNFDKEILKSSIPVIVDFWAEWCAPCRLISPIVEELSNEYEGKLKIAKLNVDHNPHISMNYGIRSIPTLLIFKDGKAVEQLIGAVPKKTIVERLKSVL
ncbi:MAG: thioredoxin [Calditrichaceae bacterium]|nr:thioredoxin [Calditrichaceae bacterium]MBN2709886.1 thioredoxin [Calditrichaceae bacterium]RQV92642.1 MAG: thioredoxin [Calditrichota bacterium]